MNHILNCNKIETAIRRAHLALIAKAKKNGLYEDFGQNEIRAIKDKFIDISDYSREMNYRRDLMDGFSRWCNNVSLSEINQY